MTIFLRNQREGGTHVIIDTADNTVFEIPSTEWPRIARLPNEQQRQALEDLILDMQRRKTQEAQP
jgi:hypothetical protein